MKARTGKSHRNSRIFRTLTPASRGFPLVVALIVYMMSQAMLAEGQPVGMVLKTSGEVFVERAGSRLPLQLADVLYEGDKLQATSGEVGVLFCPENSRLSLAPGSSIQLDSKRFQVLKGAAPEAQMVRRCSLPKVALSADSQERIGGIKVRKAGLPELTLYLGGPVANRHPLFRWEPHPGAQSYQVSLRAPDGTEFWEASTTQTQLPYPSDRSPLAPGVYEWEVEAHSGGRAVAAAETRFEVRPEAGLSSPASSADPAELLMSAVELENAGFYAEAANLYEQARSHTSAGGNFNRHLAWLYLQAGLNRAAQKVMQP